MDVDGRGEAKRRRSEVESLIEAIKSSEVLENRVSFVNQLEGSLQSSEDDLGHVVESLIVFWDDSTCSGVSHCMLHKSILKIAVRCSDTDIANCLGHFLVLGAKASSWCGKHLPWSIESIDESEEEQSRLFPEIVSLTLSISIKLLPSVTKCIAVDMLHIVGDFISQLLTLTETSIVESKKIHGAALHIQRAAPVVLDETIKLCRAYCEAAKSDHCKMSMPVEEPTVQHKKPNLTIDVTRITACTIQALCKIGTYAASSGGSQVTLLNLSWKGVVSLLQLGKGLIEEKVDIRNIIITLLSLAIESLRVAAETWFTTLQEALGKSEARRAFLPIKFFLINAVRICSVYPFEAMNTYITIIRCVLVVSSSSILFSKESRLRAAGEALAELLEPNSFLLLDALLNSSEVKPESKCQLLQWFLKNGEATGSTHMEQGDQRELSLASLGCIFAMDSDDEHRKRALLPAEVIVFLHFLNASPGMREEVFIELSKKLQDLLDILTLEDVYSYVLGCQIPALCCSEQTPVVIWQPMYTFLIQALKTYMVAAAASCVASNELGAFLLENLFHPHFLCLEIATELLCFFVRYAETETSIYLINQLFLLLKNIASPEKALAPLSTLRKVARAMCIILSYASPATTDQIYTSVLSDDNSSMSSILYLALLMEGFPFDSLSEGTKQLAVKKLFTSFAGYLERCSKDYGEIDLPGSSSSGIAGLPIHALASALRHCEIKDVDVIDEKSITTMFKFTISLIGLYRSALKSTKNHLAQHIGSILDIISNMKHLCAFNDMENLTLELHTLFTSRSDDSNAVLYQCKPSLASYMAVLCHLNITEDEANTLCSAIWDLYRFLLREQHWAFIHLAIASFGHFAARASFAQLWRFVPDDAALSYNTSTGMDIDENRFMSEFKAFFEKEVALHADIWSEEQICFLVSEGRTLKNLVKASCEIPQISGSDKVVITNDIKTKRRKIPDGFYEGMVLLQNGLEVMRSTLDETDFAELKDKFTAHMSRLEDAVSQLASLSDRI